MKILGPVIDKAVGLDEIEATSLESLERLRAVLAFCGKRIGGSDPLTVPPNSLDAILGALETEKTEIEAFINDRAPAHLTNANVSADAALLSLAQIPAISTPEELVGLMGAISSYRAAIEEYQGSSSTFRKQAKAQIDELTATLEALKTQTLATSTELKAGLDAERQKISAQASEQQKLFSEAQEGRSKTYNEALLKIQETLSKTLGDQQGQFSGAQENRSREFTAAQTESQKRFGDLIADHSKKLAEQDAEFTKQRDMFVATSTQQLKELHDNYEAKAEEILDHVNARRGEVEKLVGVIGSLGVTSGYQKAANNARVSMWIWQSVAVVSMAVVIFFAYHAFLPTLQGEFKWPSFAARIFLTITVGVLAAYAAAQADRFFQMEKYNRKLALELAAIDPFIALFPLDEQQKFKLEIGRRSFAQDETTAAKHEKSPATALDVLLGSEQGKALLQIAIDTAQKTLKKS
jgi:hypothetical protein